VFLKTHINVKIGLTHLKEFVYNMYHILLY
jgi:hypothetical protein